MSVQQLTKAGTAWRLWLVASLLVAGCGPDRVIETGLTGVDLTVIAGREIDQLSIAGEVDGQEPFERTLVPDQPRPLDPAGESAVLVVGEDLAGAALVLTVDGLVEGVMLVRGDTQVTLVARQLVEATIELDCVGRSCICDAESCPSGCCDGDACLAGDDPAGCGSGGAGCVECEAGDECRAGVCSACDASSCAGCCLGAACVACDPALADTCSEAGECRCGGGPACDASSADRCIGGECRCGDDAACATGQRCAGSACACDSISCPDGCCDETVCEPGTEDDACGGGGERCHRCHHNDERCVDRTCEDD
jgi:hypothetical protein